MSRPFTTAGAPPAVPPDPLFTLDSLGIRSGWRNTSGAAWFDFFWARNAIFHGLRALGIRPGEKVLAPAYLCTAAIQPIEHFGAEVEFYAIGRDCVPDWLDLEARIRDNVRAILAVHYFGFPCDIEKFCALRERYDVRLIEDCAHVLGGMSSPHRLGEFGDFSVFSPRKFVPVFDGGRLQLNRAAPGFQVRFQFETPVFTLRVAKNLLERRKLPSEPLLSSVEQCLSPANNGSAPSRSENRPEKPRYVFPNSTSFLPWMAEFPMSRLSKHLLAHFSIQDIASRRRANYDALLERIARMKGIRPLFEHLPPGVVPWVLPVTIGQGVGAHTRLRALGIPAVTWDGVRDSRISADDFPDADFLYNHLVFLPIHQNLADADLDLIAGALAKVCASGSR